MRKALLVLVFVLSCGLSFGQKIRFCDSTNVWHGFEYDLANVPYYSYAFTWQYTGDTVVSGTIYHKLTYNAVPGAVLVREDIAAGKVYIDTQVLYDYTLAIGDTFFFAGTRPHVVTAKDSVIINGVYHRTWHLERSTDTPVTGFKTAPYDVVEGIGCLNSPLFPTDPSHFESSTSLTCFNSNGTTPSLSYKVAGYFDNSTSCSLTFGAGIKQLSHPKGTVTVYPNPIDNTTKIIFLNNISSGKLIILNSMARQFSTTPSKIKMKY